MPKTLEEFAIQEIERLREENQKLATALITANENLAKAHEEKLILKEAIEPKLRDNHIAFSYVWSTDPLYKEVKTILELKENENE